MSETFYVRPAKGRLVRDPKTKAKLSEKGGRKPHSTFWVRRVTSKDVEIIEEPSNG